MGCRGFGASGVPTRAPPRMGTVAGGAPVARRIGPVSSPTLRPDSLQQYAQGVIPSSWSTERYPSLPSLCHSVSIAPLLPPCDNRAGPRAGMLLTEREPQYVQ